MAGFRTGLAGVLALMVAGAALGAGEVPPFRLPAPDGWKKETIPFPLDFAPGLGYQGLEELRFAPGMFTEGAEDFWSYVFVWWLDGEIPLDSDSLGTELAGYFEGLAQAVAEDKGIELPSMAFAARLQSRLDRISGQVRMVGHARAFDAFTTFAPIDLNVRARVAPCRVPGKTVAIFEVSPQPFSHPIWKDMGAIREGLDCSP